MVQPDTMDLEEDESQSIVSVTAYYSDSNTANIPLANCSYYSYNPSCATVNTNGLITGVSTGSTTTMVIYTEETISKTDTVTINVTTAPITPAILSYIEVSPSIISLSVGESETFNSVTAYYSDSSTTNINLLDCNYSSINPDYATVSSSGTVTAVSDGSTTIMISYAENGVTKTTSVEITVGTVTQNEV
ncbi:MAG: Ig-like domain-containing protein, partial [Clostridiaceae bacterium]|nr:Ig-like domain-containing protein [Clostridiaceae bacterium]